MRQVKVKRAAGLWLNACVLTALIVFVSYKANVSAATLSAATESGTIEPTAAVGNTGVSRGGSNFGKDETAIFLRGHREIDFGDVHPEETETARFFFGVKSTVPYVERFLWTDFTQEKKTVSENRLKLYVIDEGAATPVVNGGTHPAGPEDPHQPSDQVNWQRVDLLLNLTWPDTVGSYQGTLTIEALSM